MKAVLISIRQTWCELIMSGKKVIEVRKTRPKLQTPFKCYIYCTKVNPPWFDFGRNTTLDGKVIGEFTCDTFITDKTCGHDALFNAMACMTEKEAVKYASGKSLYGWVIADLKIYDRPKEPGDFARLCPAYRTDVGRCWECLMSVGDEHDCGTNGLLYIKRPPQSWCYVEDRST